ncbi:MAG: porin family protein [Halothiobacillaceae bacterium]|nr:porin family protein [Halothiobacillaceae bacterium]
MGRTSLRGFISIVLCMCAGLQGSAYAAGGVVIRAFSAPAIPAAAADDNKAPGQAGPQVGAPQQLLNDATALLNAGKTEEAYQLLSAKDFEYSGNAQFDYLLGIAALDSGHPDKATLALERVLAADPNFAGARLDMARAYFHLGDLPRAKTELEAVMKQEPPEAARITIEKYLQAIDSAEKAKATQYSAYVEGTVGRDTNANNSTSQSQVAVPAFGDLVFTLNPTSLKTPATYYAAAAGGEVNHVYSDRWSAYAGIDVRQRNNNKLHAYDSGSVDMRTGAALDVGGEVFRLGVTWGFYEQAHLKNRNAYGISAGWQHNFGPKNQLNLFGQHGKNRYSESAYQVNDFNQSVIGLGMLHILGEGRTALFESINVMKEGAVSDRADGSKTGYGLRVGGQTAVADDVEVFVNAGYQKGRYDKENLAFLTKRDDKQIDVALGGNWSFAKSWTLRPQLSYTRNKSNIAIYSFDRIDASITVRRDFR